MIKQHNKVNKNLLLRIFLIIMTITTAFISLPSCTENNNGLVIQLHEAEQTRSAGQTYLDRIITNTENVIIVFYEDWCGPCKRMTPIIEEIAQENTNILFIKIKREYYRAIFDAYNLSTVPAILFFKNGTLKKIQPSSLDKKALTQMIKKIYNI